MLTAIPTANTPSRSRWAPSGTQRVMLEAAFAVGAFPDASSRESLARELGINARQVQVWFQNRRQKERAKNKVVKPAKAATAPTAPPAMPPTLSAASMMPPPPPLFVPFGTGCKTPSPPTVTAVVEQKTPSPPPLALAPVPLVPTPLAPPFAPAIFGQPNVWQSIDLLEGMLRPSGVDLKPRAMGPPVGIPHDLSLERQLTSLTTNLMRGARANMMRPPIAKQQAWKCRPVPLTRSARSMDALEVLSTQFSA